MQNQIMQESIAIKPGLNTVPVAETVLLSLSRSLALCSPRTAMMLVVRTPGHTRDHLQVLGHH